MRGGVYSELSADSTSSSSSRSSGAQPALLCCRFGSKGSTTICSVPLISARQNGHPCPSESCNMEHTVNPLIYTADLPEFLPLQIPVYIYPFFPAKFGQFPRFQGTKLLSLNSHLKFQKAFKCYQESLLLPPRFGSERVIWTAVISASRQHLLPASFFPYKF